MSQLKQIIEEAFKNKDEINFNTKGKIRESVEETLNQLDVGNIRVCEKINNDWVVNQWIKKAILLSFRLNDNEITELLFPLNHEQTETQALVERAFLQVLDGSCRTPIGSISKIDGEKIIFSGQVLKPDGTEIISGYWEGLVGNPKDLGKMAGNEIKEKIDDSFFKQENFSH